MKKKNDIHVKLQNKYSTDIRWWEHKYIEKERKKNSSLSVYTSIPIGNPLIIITVTSIEGTI